MHNACMHAFVSRLLKLVALDLHEEGNYNFFYSFLVFNGTTLRNESIVYMCSDRLTNFVISLCNGSMREIYLFIYNFGNR